MTDAELADFLGVAGHPDEAKFIATIRDGQRKTYERMREVEQDIKLWQAGIGPKPTGVILCHEHKSKHQNAES